MKDNFNLKDKDKNNAIFGLFLLIGAGIGLAFTKKSYATRIIIFWVVLFGLMLGWDGGNSPDADAWQFLGCVWFLYGLFRWIFHIDKNGFNK